MPDRHANALAVLDRERQSLGINELSSVTRDDGRCEVELRVVVGGEVVRLRLLLPVTFPHGEVEIFVGEDWRRYAHQNHQGKICPDPAWLTSTGDERIVQVVEAARGWIEDARSGALTPPEGDYELPSFPASRAAKWMLVFDDEAREPARWAGRVGERGTVQLKYTGLSHIGEAWAAVKFSSLSREEIAGRTSIRVKDDAISFEGSWVMTRGLSADDYLVPKTWADLRAFVPDLDAAVRLAWKRSRQDKAALLVGWPMPEKWDGPTAAIHWRPVVFESRAGARKRLKKQGARRNKREPKVSLRKPGQLWRSTSPLVEPFIPWAPAEDVSRERLYARAAESGRMFNHVLLLGAGAIGSALADGLVRNGLSAIRVVDKDFLEHGNLCRHVLTGVDVGAPKAWALARHLEQVSPHVRAYGAPMSLPPATTNEAQQFETHTGLADVVVDATGNDDVLRWLSSSDGSRPVVSIWTNSDASVGVGVVSGLEQGTDVARLRDHVVEQVDAGRVPGVTEKSYRGPPPIRPGIGCWHPTFRGSGSRLSGLAASFVEWIETAVRGSTDGRVVVFRFHEGGWRRARAWHVSSEALIGAASGT